ncbi:pentatricopeptide repeat-containing protein At1g62350-like [Vigna unguiculata]|uniref:pentatricopeptide repeat-containing protein At1g62350-like n=1 Tax=Vigna unguiculata TaxID=3917 RepID=UPI0010162E8F|nr:pentatricopeptide repeat-containing protein At1g62350-like [Vigna unguiculata]XP_027925921.1 pentatricopeptide repeat-containing protein At1g62350-like [Vigna unguiculata]
MILRVSERVALWGSERRFSSSNLNYNRPVTVCGLRSGYKARRRTRILSKESIQVIHALKLAKSPDHVLDAKLSRLLKPDALNLFDELLRQNELSLSLKVFHFIREEVGHDTLLQLYADMILLLGRNMKIDMAEELFSQVSEKGLKPDTRMCGEMIGAYLQAGMTEKAMEIYGSMKEWGCSPDKFIFTVLITNLERNEQQQHQQLVESLKQDCFHYVEFPDKFLQQLQQDKPRKRRVDLV